MKGFLFFSLKKKNLLKNYQDYMHKRTMPKITFTNHDYKVGIGKWHTSQLSGINVFKCLVTLFHGWNVSKRKENSWMILWLQITISVVNVPLKSWISSNVPAKKWILFLYSTIILPANPPYICRKAIFPPERIFV